jgi:hypothetical protein
MINEDIKVSTFTLFANDENVSEPKKILDERIQISDEAY